MSTEPRSNTDIIISALHIIARDLEFTESAAVCEAAGRLEELDQQVRKLQGDNKALVSQNQYLRQRPDLPVDRIPAYKANAEQIANLKAQNGLALALLTEHFDEWEKDSGEWDEFEWHERVAAVIQSSAANKEAQ